MPLGEFILFLAIAGASGSLMAVQGSINASLGKNIGLLPTTFIVNLLGLLTTGLLLIFFPAGHGIVKKIPTIPPYSWLVGPIGVAIVFGVATAISRLGVGATTTGIIFFQLITAYLIDHFGLLGQEHIPFTWVKSLGIILMVVGSYLLLRK